MILSTAHLWATHEPTSRCLIVVLSFLLCVSPLIASNRSLQSSPMYGWLHALQWSASSSNSGINCSDIVVGFSNHTLNLIFFVRVLMLHTTLVTQFVCIWRRIPDISRGNHMPHMWRHMPRMWHHMPHMWRHMPRMWCHMRRMWHHLSRMWLHMMRVYFSIREHAIRIQLSQSQWKQSSFVRKSKNAFRVSQEYKIQRNEPILKNMKQKIKKMKNP